MLTFFTLFDVRMIQISTFPVAPSTERVPSLAERVASLRYSINLQLLNNRVPALLHMPGLITLWHPCSMEINIKTIKSRRTSLSSLPCAMIAPPTCFPASHTELSSSQTWPLGGRKSLKSLIRTGVLLDLHHCNLSRNGCAYFVPALCKYNQRIHAGSLSLHFL